jgi:hypothetical protein
VPLDRAPYKARVAVPTGASPLEWLAILLLAGHGIACGGVIQAHDGGSRGEPRSASRPAAARSGREAPAAARASATDRIRVEAPLGSDFEPGAQRLATLGGTPIPPANAAPALAALAEEGAGRGAPIHLVGCAARAALPAGRSVVLVDVPAGHFVSIGVFGASGALLGFDLAGSRLHSHGSLDEDALLPHVVSFVPPETTTLTAIVDVAGPVEIARISADPADAAAPPRGDLKKGIAAPRPLVGLPSPRSRDDGYLLQSPARYLFLRVDVANALLAALRQTRVRFRRDPVAIADISQWDGRRPATDLGRPRHISHEGGRDVDIALPANDGEPSTVRLHCSGVLVQEDVYGCAPGTARGVDTLRLAYLLGLLIDAAPGRIEKIFIDEVYMREIHRAAQTLRDRRWIKVDGFAALSEDGLLRASHWHTDHIHVRFSGELGRAAW